MTIERRYLCAAKKVEQLCQTVLANSAEAAEKDFRERHNLPEGNTAVYVMILPDSN